MNERVRPAGRITMAFSLVASLGTLVPPASASAEVITITDNEFAPKTTPVLSPGGQVEWSYAGGGNEHSVHQVDGLFDSGDPTNETFTYAREFSAGTFDYQCEVHLSMEGTVRVKPMVWPDFEGGGLPLVVWAYDGTNTGSSFDVQYRVGTNDWKKWKADTVKYQGRFGAGQSPVVLKPGKDYFFRARSQRNSSVSKWSPVRKYTHNVS